jgi:hypothetical protein
MSICRKSVVAIAVALCLLSTSRPANTQARFTTANLSSLKPVNNAPEPLPLPDISKLNELQKAYLDSYSILSQKNSCSEFFGGPPSISALNELIGQLRPSHLDREIGIRMSGSIMTVTNAQTGLRYRLFKKAEINLDGPFYLANNSRGRQTNSSVGDFSSTTREARVTVLLHELGHLVRKNNGEYLLPNDGTDFEISRQNTDRIIAVCGEQIRQLHNATFEEELFATQSQQTSAEATPSD